jgi:hypothetical protein
MYDCITNKNNNIESFTSMDNLNDIDIDDKNYFDKFETDNQIFTKLINNNLTVEFDDKKNKILFITFDNRESDYLTLHNKNLQNYVDKYNYDYNFLTSCEYNVYWCKIQFVLDALNTNKYDYVMWLDSDTIIRDDTIDIGNILNKYTSDIFVASDNIKKYDLINAGMFIIKNTNIGKDFLKDCIQNVNKKCFNDDGTLKGIWAASCYEQGQMNLLIADKYQKNTTVLTNDILLNYGLCLDGSFIIHLYASSDSKRKECFLPWVKNK